MTTADLDMRDRWPQRSTQDVVERIEQMMTIAAINFLCDASPIARYMAQVDETSVHPPKWTKTKGWP